MEGQGLVLRVLIHDGQRLADLLTVSLEASSQSGEVADAGGQSCLRLGESVSIAHGRGVGGLWLRVALLDRKESVEVVAVAKDEPREPQVLVVAREVKGE